MCVVKGCHEGSRRKAVMCAKHWFTLPITLRDDVRRGTEKGNHTLRAHPSREWLSTASKYVGDVKNLHVYVDSDNKLKRRFKDAKPQDEPTASVA